MTSVWFRFLLRTVFVCIGGAFVGLIIGQLWAGIALALFSYGAWHGFYLYRLVRWLQDDIEVAVPRGVGIWGDVFYQIGRMRRRGEERSRFLQDTLLQYRRSIDALPDAAIVLDEHSRIRFANGTAERMLGVSRRDAGQYLPNLLRHPEFGAYMSGNDFQAPMLLSSPLDSQLQLSISVTEYGGGQRLVLARDVSEPQRLEQSRRDFVANASHEVRTPLTVIVGYLETMASDDDESMRVWQGPVQHMREQAARMERILKDLLTLARLDNAWVVREKNDTVRMSGLIEAACADAEQISEGHKLSLELSCSRSVLGNMDELQSVVSNLITNAVRHTPVGTEVAVRWVEQDGGALFEVSDNGPGIAVEHLPRLTERFYRVDAGRSRESGGTGLGLAIVAKLLERQGAQFDIESSRGNGATFSCFFPQGCLVTNKVEMLTVVKSA